VRENKLRNLLLIAGFAINYFRPVGGVGSFKFVLAFFSAMGVIFYFAHTGTGPEVWLITKLGKLEITAVRAFARQRYSEPLVKG